MYRDTALALLDRRDTRAHADGGRIKALRDRGYRGASYYYSDSPKLKRLNTVATVFEYEADADGNTKSKLWEWK